MDPDTNSNVKELFNYVDLNHFVSLMHNINTFTIHIMTQSITRNFSRLLNYIENSIKQIDVIVLTEVNIPNIISSLYNLEGYELHMELRKKAEGRWNNNLPTK